MMRMRMRRTRPVASGMVVTTKFTITNFLIENFLTNKLLAHHVVMVTRIGDWHDYLSIYGDAHQWLVCTRQFRT